MIETESCYFRLFINCDYFIAHFRSDCLFLLGLYFDWCFTLIVSLHWMRKLW